MLRARKGTADWKRYPRSNNMMNFRISLARLDQLTEIMSLWQKVESWAESGVGRIWHDYEISEHAVCSYLARGELFTLTENSTGGVLGTIMLTEYDPNQCWETSCGANALYVQRVVTDRGSAGHGLGRELLNFAEHTASSRNLRFLRLDCDSERPKLCRVYEEFGFKRVGSAIIAGFNAALYEKDLGNNQLDAASVVRTR